VFYAARISAILLLDQHMASQLLSLDLSQPFKFVGTIISRQNLQNSGLWAAVFGLPTA
jgi:hypothetical protein